MRLPWYQRIIYVRTLLPVLVDSQALVAGLSTAAIEEWSPIGWGASGEWTENRHQGESGQTYGRQW